MIKLATFFVTVYISIKLKYGVFNYVDKSSVACSSYYTFLVIKQHNHADSFDTVIWTYSTEHEDWGRVNAVIVNV